MLKSPAAWADHDLVWAWIRALAAIAVIYAAAAYVSLLMALDNFDGYGGIAPSDEVLFAVGGFIAVSAVAAPFFVRRGRLPLRGAVVALVVAVTAAVTAGLLEAASASDARAGESVPAHAVFYGRLGLIVLAVAPVFAALLVGRQKRRQLFVGTAASTAASWFVAFAVLTIHYR